ncbi:MAG: formate/nitrite transporter family protein [Methanobrevibacter sp.]|jgi:formate/nitrite transporter|uniref:formate/nitrite transporter family protein n=1 Tax=Methanobrevibacter sp. TaxID=66852 RepID=UPI002E87700B|nr:formate/nitrite transporter family protein [Methanobrevibacter sp.]MEE3419372.1 formate/nitrite transporter family protein [Methanosphaera sp.]
MSFKSPADTAKAVASAATAKGEMPILNLAILGFLAGAYIAFGGLLAEVANTGVVAAGVPIGISKFIFGAVFPVGLILVVICGSELFTGDVMFMTMGLLDGKTDIMGLLKNWIGSWVFNLIGGIFVAFVLAYLTGIMTGEAFAKGAITIANTKALGGAAFGAEATKSLTWVQAFTRAIGCNWLVCCAVYLANAADDIISKIVGIWFPIMAFVCIGFEHSVANMFFIPLGIFLGAEVTWAQFFINNLIPVTLGNIVGGAVFVAMAYWFVYLRD